MLKEYKVQEYMDKIHAQNRQAGWWDGEIILAEKYQLVLCELAEATEAVRRDKADDRLPQYPGAAVELVDAAIRMMDLMSRQGIAFLEHERPIRPALSTAAVCHLWLSALVTRCYHFDLARCSVSPLPHSQFLNTLTEVFTRFYPELDFWQVLDDKLAYNEQRAYHKRENRAAQGGKKF